MPRPSSRPARILAHHLYDLVVCDHRIALDFTLPRDFRTPPDEAAALLHENGLAHERAVIDALGYPEIETENHDWEAAAARTLDAMRRGFPGIAQGVLIDGDRLARPDLLERVDGESRLGAWHYAPGDVKSALSPRSDAALQIGFAAKILESIQGVRPGTGFVVLGDGTREEIDLHAISRSVDDAAEAVEEVARGRAETSPFFSRDCARCRWRTPCLERLAAASDPSFVHGMTRARRRAYAKAGILTLHDLASANESDLRAAGVPTEGLSRLRAQARALLEKRAVEVRPVDLPRGRRREHFLRIEANPLERSDPFALAWGSSPAGGPIDRVEATLVARSEERSAAFLRLVADLEATSSPDDPVYFHGAVTEQCFARLGASSSLSPARLGELQGRLLDLAPWVRRAAVLPVLRYRFDEIAAFLRGRPVPPPEASEDARFVAFASGSTDRVARIVEDLRDDLESLALLRDWLLRGGNA
jgi:predicted RecB family nuclease